jgi:C4-dicarboxylate-specific signal transduction histidine kinase
MGQLTASIAHEVNQPLMAIVTNADICLSWLARDTPQIDEARKAPERIVSDGHRAGDIIKTVRALARKSQPAMTQLDMNDVIAEVLAPTRSELRRHDVSLGTELSGGLETVMADRIQVQQVIVNLVMNGIEAMNEIMERPRVLPVSSQIDGSGSVLIAVSDTGTGLDPTKMDRIFDAFFTTKPEGMGMGLSICRSIIEAHGGRLWASPNLPHGSVFKFITI